MNARFSLTLFALLLGLAIPAGASAGSATHVSGTSTLIDPGITVCYPVGGNGFIANCSTTLFVSPHEGASPARR